MDFDDFKDKAAEILNLKLDGYKIKRVKRRTDSLMRRRNINNYEQCLNLIKNESKFRRAYINHFTINTSEFYRNPQNYRYLQNEILPSLVSNDKLKIWSAPCSNGSEPYTVAIILNELGISSHNYEILASDLDPDIINDAKRGIYNKNYIKDVPASIIKKYFTVVNDTSEKKYKLARNIKNSVKFEERDLIYSEYKDGWDIIISRNFFIYLTRELKDEIIKKFASALKKGGYLFLGNTEFIFRAEQYGLKKEKLSFYKKI